MGMELWPPWLTPRPFLKLLHVKDMHKEECEQNQKTMNHELKCIYQIPKNPTSFQKEKQKHMKRKCTWICKLTLLSLFSCFLH